MARERMAKLLKYGHFERHTGHVIINFMIISKYQHQRGAPIHRYLGSSPADEDLAYTITSAAWRKKCLTQIECADL